MKSVICIHNINDSYLWKYFLKMDTVEANFSIFLHLVMSNLKIITILPYLVVHVKSKFCHRFLQQVLTNFSLQDNKTILNSTASIIRLDSGKC